MRGAQPERPRRDASGQATPPNPPENTGGREGTLTPPRRKGGRKPAPQKPRRAARHRGGVDAQPRRIGAGRTTAATNTTPGASPKTGHADRPQKRPAQERAGISEPGAARPQTRRDPARPMQTTATRSPPTRYYALHVLPNESEGAASSSTPTWGPISKVRSSLRDGGTPL